MLQPYLCVQLTKNVQKTTIICIPYTVACVESLMFAGETNRIQSTTDFLEPVEERLAISL